MTAPTAAAHRANARPTIIPSPSVSASSFVDAPTDLEVAFAAAINRGQPIYLQPTSLSYQELFWKPYLGLLPFGLWRTLCALEEQIASERRGRWPTVEVISATLGQGDRHIILGREATRTRPHQPGILSVLVAELLVTYQTTGEGVKQRYVFKPRPLLPMLAPSQVKLLPSVLRKRHKKLVVDKMPQRSAAAWSAVRFPTLVGVSG